MERKRFVNLKRLRWERKKGKVKIKTKEVVKGEDKLRKE